ncbi:MAG TPA: hypothetical protein H9857_08305, partial [Candidatus Desulfovibrio intestinigallinarum]|nr:hypothetical protein [Candidatus Desulfovibrio intestinigallinarum]
TLQRKQQRFQHERSCRPEHFQFEMLRISNHTACTAASRFTLFKGETLQAAGASGRAHDTLYIKFYQKQEKNTK